MMGGRSWSRRGERPRLVTHMLAHGVCHRTFAGSGVSRATESVQSSHVSRRRLVRGVALGTWHTVAHNTLTAKAATLAEGFQRSKAHGEGRNGDRSLRHHPLRGLDPPCQRACLTGRLRPSGLRAEAPVDVCRDPGLSRQTPSSSPSAATDGRRAHRGEGGQCHAQGLARVADPPVILPLGAYGESRPCGSGSGGPRLVSVRVLGYAETVAERQTRVRTR